MDIIFLYKNDIKILYYHINIMFKKKVNIDDKINVINNPSIVNNEKDIITYHNDPPSDIEEDYENNSYQSSKNIVTFKDIEPEIITEEVKLPELVKEKSTNVFFVIQCCHCNDDNTIFKKCKYFMCCLWCPCYTKFEE